MEDKVHYRVFCFLLQAYTRQQNRLPIFILEKFSTHGPGAALCTNVVTTFPFQLPRKRLAQTKCEKITPRRVLLDMLRP